MTGENSKYTYSWFINQFKQAKTHSKNLISETNIKYIYRKPVPSTWSIVECINHLNQFGNIYYRKINQKLEHANFNASLPSQSFKLRLMWRGVIRLFEPPYKLKLKTISIFEPSPREALNSGSDLDIFLALQNKFIEQLERCREKSINLDNEKISNPALPFLKMRISESYGIVLAHQHRHLWQAEQIRDKLMK